MGTEMSVLSEIPTAVLMGLAAAFGSIISWVAKGAWSARDLQAAIESKAAEKVEELRQSTSGELKAIRMEGEDQRTRIERNVGEGLAAMREDSTKFKFWCRDNFVLKEDFQGLARSLEAMRSDARASELRLGEKIDQIMLAVNERRDRS